MHTAYIIVTALAIAANVYGVTADLTRPQWILDNMTRLGVPHSQLLPLGILKAAGALGLLVGLAVPAIGVAAAVGLVLFFVGAILTALRARWYGHLPYPTVYLALAAGSLALLLAS